MTTHMCFEKYEVGEGKWTYKRSLETGLNLKVIGMYSKRDCMGKRAPKFKEGLLANCIVDLVTYEEQFLLIGERRVARTIASTGATHFVR